MNTRQEKAVAALNAAFKQAKQAGLWLVGVEGKSLVAFVADEELRNEAQSTDAVATACRAVNSGDERAVRIATCGILIDCGSP